MIDLTALVALRAVAEYGGVAAAAAELGFTPSAVSQQVKRLERQTGVPLLERVGRGVILTIHGRHLVEEGSRLLTDIESIESKLHRRLESVSGLVRIAAFATAIRGLVAPAIGNLLAGYPGLSATVGEREPWETVDLVASGHADIGIVHTWGDLSIAIPQHCIATTLAHDLADVIVSADHQLASRTSVTPHDLVGAQWIATPDGTICRQWLTRMYAGTGHTPQIAHTALEFGTQLELVEAGLGIALVPRLGRSPLGKRVAAIAVREPEPSREIIALHRRSMTDSPAIQAVLDALATHSQG